MLPANYDPLSLFERLQQQVNQTHHLFSALNPDDESNIMISRWTPAVDIKEEDERYVIHADIPGVNPDEISVTIENGTLVIKGERKSEIRRENKSYSRVERSYGIFYRRFALPESADYEKISASSKNGVLELSIPKRKSRISKKIQVEN